jgi:putative CocE/NonD family hydrolase
VSRADTPVKPDEGKFIITVQEAEIGVDAFSITTNGVVDGRSSVNLGGHKLEAHNVTTIVNGRTQSIFTEAVGHGKFRMDVKDQTGKITVEDKPHKDQQLALPFYPFGNFSPHLIAYLVAAYDVAKGGPQKFNTLIVDGVGADGVPSLKMTLTSLGAKPRKIGGKTVPIARYALVIPGPIGNIDSEIDTDTTGRVLLWTVPGQKLDEVRDGYQELLQPETPTDPLLSKPTYKVVVEHKIMVAMRDGVKLATDVYRPDADGKFPVILQRTPYGRGMAFEATSYAKRGYVFVAQDVRGRFDSEGDFHPFVLEAKDGYDSTEWSAAQPWSTGSVGMIGGSYLGFVQWAAAREGSPHLKCLIPIVSPPDPFFNVPYEYGVLFLSPDLWWANAVKVRNALSIEPPATALKNLDAFKTLPLTDVDKAVLGVHIPFFQEWLQHSTNDDYYGQVNFNERMKTMGPMPALHVSGWFDGDGIGTKLNYAGMVSSGHSGQRLIYGPWGHAVNTTTRIGPFDFGPQSLRDLDTLYLRWFDHWLKGVDNGVDRELPVEAFLMGSNTWRQFSAWPPREAVLQKWFLHSGGRANNTTGDGTLAIARPGAAEPPDRYTYDPADPFIPGGSAGLKKAVAAVEAGEEAKLGLPDQRPDLLYYRTPPLSHDVTVAGPISLHIVAGTSARDTDWFAMLEDVYPDGRVAGLCRGIVRARFRKSFAKPALLQPGEVSSYDLDLWATGNVFKKGHRIQLLVTSSFFPVYARNLNTGGDIATETKMATARQTIYHTAARPSYLLLPVLPAKHDVRSGGIR